jgi:hypothetical protein
MKIERDKKYKLRDGSVVTVVDASGTNANAIVVRDGAIVTLRWPSGRLLHARESGKDIVAEYREPLVLYVNEYEPNRPGDPTSFGGAYREPTPPHYPNPLLIRTIKMVEVEEKSS